jgi:probable addiction module antidote protein
MTDYKNVYEISEEYFAANPDKIDAYLTEIFAVYAKDADSATLLSQLRVVARVKGISAMAEEIGITRQGLQKALSGRGNPRLENVNAIMRSMGYLLTPQRI